jgi:hypothetical protein
MIYWSPTKIPGERADFRTLLQDFSVLSSWVAQLAGISVEAGTLSDLQKEIGLVRKAPYVGMVLFSYQLLKKRNWLHRMPELFGISP